MAILQVYISAIFESANMELEQDLIMISCHLNYFNTNNMPGIRISNVSFAKFYSFIFRNFLNIF